MKKVRKGDIVGRISYGKDVIFKVERIITLKNKKKLVLLTGITERIEADCDIKDLYLIPKDILKKKLYNIDEKIEKRLAKEEPKRDNRSEQFIDGKILHLDGDRRYSQKSLRYYKKMGVQAIVKNIQENRQPKMVYELLKYYEPDILVITGHDGMIKSQTGYHDIYNYRNSRHFIATVKEARRYERDFNKDLVIFAGACQSYYEALIMAGANFASSPARILIDILDPIIVAENISKTNYMKYITIDDIEDKLRDGRRGVSGIGANGKQRSFVTIM